MTQLVLGLFLIGCRGAEPAPVPAPQVVTPAVVQPKASKPKLKLPPADHVPYTNPKVTNHEGGRRASGASAAQRNGSGGASSDEANEWQWPANATKPTVRNAPRYDANGRRVYRTSELIDDQELSSRLQQRGR